MGEEADALTDMYEMYDTYYEEKSDLERKLEGIEHRYNIAKNAKIGSMIQCAYCGKHIKKTTYHKKFCSNQKTSKNKSSCKDKYWNLIDFRRFSYNSSSKL